MKGVRREKLVEYLHEFMWRERFGSPKSESFDSIIADISAQYPVWHDTTIIIILLYIVNL